MAAMDASFRFLQASDLHLERPPHGLAEVPDHLRAALIEAPYRAAERVFAAAIKHQVDFVVLSGDVVDPWAAGPRAFAFLEEQFQKLAEQRVRVYWAGGRADHFEHWSESWPLGSHVFRFPLARIERVIHERAGQPIAEILGTSSEQRRRVRSADFRRDNPALFCVAVAYGTTDPETLSQHNVNYWALGGEHARRSLLCGTITGHYCGSTQGRRLQEAGPHGCTLVEVDQGRVRTTFVPTDAVRYCDLAATVDETVSVDQLASILSTRTAELLVDPFGPELLVRWTVSGSRSLARQLAAGKVPVELASRLRQEHGSKHPAAWTLEVRAAEPEQVPAELADEETLLGEYLRTVRHYVEHGEESLKLENYLAERQLAGSLGALVSLEDPAVRERILTQVAALGVELLGQPADRAPAGGTRAGDRGSTGIGVHSAGRAREVRT